MPPSVAVKCLIVLLFVKLANGLFTTDDNMSYVLISSSNIFSISARERKQVFFNDADIFEERFSERSQNCYLTNSTNC